MKKGILLAGAAVVVAYPATAWFLGGVVDSTLASQYQIYEAESDFRIVEREFKRGVFSSEEHVVIELLGGLAEAVAATDGSGAMEPVRLTFDSTIQHGPLPGFSSLGAASMDSQMVLPESVNITLAESGSDKPLISAHTVFGFGGGGSSEMIIQAASFELPVDPATDPVVFNWDALTASMTFDKNLDRITWEGGLPLFEMTAEGQSLVMEKLTFDADQSRLDASEPLLYGGDQSFAIEKVSIDNQMANMSLVMQAITSAVHMPATDEYVDIDVNIAVGEAQTKETTYGPIALDFGFNHLHKETLIDVYGQYMDLYNNPEQMMAADPFAPNPALDSLKSKAAELLNFEPKFSVSKLAFTAPEGDVDMDLTLGLGDVDPDLLANPMFLFTQLQAAGSVAISEPLMIAFAASYNGARMGLSPEETQAMMEQQIASMVEMGFVTRDGSVLKSSLKLEEGEMLVNGQPFNPMAGGY